MPSKLITTIECDLSNSSEVEKLLDNLPKIDILINNAGVMNSLPFNDYPQDKLAMLMQLNLYTPVKLISELSKQMMSQNYGRIVNVASVAGQVGHPDVWYGISKAAIINATKSFAQILGGKGIVINAVAPGPVETNMLNVIPEPRKKAVKAAAYLNRFAMAAEVAETIYWLATKSPEYINGTCIDINNGINHR